MGTWDCRKTLLGPRNDDLPNRLGPNRLGEIDFPEFYANIYLPVFFFMEGGI